MSSAQFWKMTFFEKIAHACTQVPLSRKNGGCYPALSLRESLPLSGKTVLIKLIAAFLSVHYRLSVRYIFLHNQINVSRGKFPGLPLSLKKKKHGLTRLPELISNPCPTRRVVVHS